MIRFQQLQFFLFIIATSLLCFHNFCNGKKVMMEYIGATGIPITFNSVPIFNNIDFHFILSFAIDADPSANPQNGKFSPYWIPSLTPDSVATIKDEHPNVKVVASLSGWSLDNIVLHWRNPPNPNLWISNAFSSLQALAIEYHLDGIDVDYENFPEGRSSFAFCIGELITLLKNHSIISIATIAPFYSTVSPYLNLFKRYREVIDFVNYQFYTDRVASADAYLKRFEVRAKQFDSAKLLPSYEVNGRGIQGDAFFEALSLLNKNGFDVNGVMIFSADASLSNAFHFERKAQEFLLNSTAA